MGERGYFLIDFTSPPELWKDWNRAVRFKEYVRVNFYRIVQCVPAGCEVDLLASGHAHNPGLVPLVGLWAPLAVRDQVPDLYQMTDQVSDWCASLSTEEVDAIVATSTAPTWEELVRIGFHPPRKHST